MTALTLAGSTPCAASVSATSGPYSSGGSPRCSRSRTAGTAVLRSFRQPRSNTTRVPSARSTRKALPEPVSGADSSDVLPGAGERKSAEGIVNWTKERMSLTETVASEGGNVSEAGSGTGVELDMVRVSVQAGRRLQEEDDVGRGYSIDARRRRVVS
jgi:hypothetical protein